MLAPAPLVPDDGKSSADRVLVDAFTVQDADLQPKSIVASGDGLFFAQNMMYRHNVAIYDRAGNKLATIPDEVDLAAFGIDDGVVQGSPVEAAFTPDGRKLVTVSMDGTARVWDTATWACERAFAWDVGPLRAVAVAPDGARAATAGDAGRVVVWDLEL